MYSRVLNAVRLQGYYQKELGRINKAITNGKTGTREDVEISFRRYIAKMNNDFNESLMLLAKKDMNEYEAIRKLSIEKYLIRYKLYIGDIIIAQEKQQQQKTQSLKRR